MLELIKEQRDLRDQVATLTMRKKASQMVAEDENTLKLKWDEIADVQEALSTQDNQEACTRLMLSDKIWDHHSRYMNSLLEFFLTRNFFGRMFWATPTG